MQHLVSIEGFLAELDPSNPSTAMYQEAVDRWTAAVFSYSHGWGGSSAASIPEADLNLLLALSSLMAVSVPVVTETGLGEAQSFVDRIRKHAQQSPPDNPVLFRHLAKVLTHVDWCLTHFELVGEFDLEEALTHLAAVVNLLADTESGTSEESNGWRGFRDNWVRPFTTSAAAGAVVRLSGLGIGALTSLPPIG